MTEGPSSEKEDLPVVNEKKEFYPEPHERNKTFKKQFSCNSTFVTFTHLIRAMLGPTILALPRGFMLGGLAFGTVGFFAILALATYNIRGLILNASYLSNRESLSVRTYDEVVYVAFKTCSDKTKRYATSLRILINVLFIVTYLDACVIFMIFTSRNFEAIINFYFPHTFLNVRFFLFLQMIFLMSMSSIRDLKRLSPFAIMSSILLFTVVIILISSYFLKNPASVDDRYLVGSAISIINFFCVVLFCLSGITIALTLKSSMRNPEHFLSGAGIFYISVCVIGVVFAVFGFLGYLKYGLETCPSVLLNVPFDSYLSLCVKLFALFSVLFTSPLVFFVAFNVLWSNYLKNHIPVSVFSEYCVRYCLIIFSFFIAVTFPNLGTMIELKGAIFHSQLELTIPPIVDYVTRYPQMGSGKRRWRLITMLLKSCIGVAFCIGGITASALELTYGNGRA